MERRALIYTTYKGSGVFFYFFLIFSKFVMLSQ